PRLLDRTRRPRDGASAVLERLAGPGALQDLDRLVEEAPALSEIPAEGGELGRDVAGREHRDQASVQDHVAPRQILGEADGVVERSDERGDHEAYLAGAGRDRRGEDERRREI